jgi:cytochrome c-type biogenesis protein CcmH
MRSAPRTRPSAATIILIVAALIALVAAGHAISRGLDDGAPGGGDSPAAKDWRIVGWAYVEAGNVPEAANAYRKAAEIEPGFAENWSSLGEVLQSASRTVVPEAEAAFRKALELDPRDPRARYFLGVQKDLAGDPKGAVDHWLAFLKDTPPGAPWEASLRLNIEQVAAKHRIDLAGRMPAAGATGTARAAIPGPSPEQLAAASSIPPGEQDAMIAQMLARLEAKLEADPRNADNWIKLMRSRMVLGETGKASAALRAGLAAFKGDAATEGRLRNAAAELGVPSA